MRSPATVTLLAGLFTSFSCAAPSSKVLVPGVGYRDVSKVHAIPDGGSISHLNSTTVHVLDASGSFVKAVIHAPTKTKAAAIPEETGWVAYASWQNTGSDPISSFTTTWTVPAEPETDNGQTVFLFNSIEPGSGDAILQPVLQYGGSAAGGGSYWAVASWYLVGESTFYSSLVTTEVGATLTGVITLTSSSGSSYNYVSSFTGIDETSITATGSTELIWATETLEAYSVTEASDYPAGSTVFSGIELTLQSGAVPNVTWSPTSDIADGISTTVNTDGATDAEITITY